MAVSRLSRAIGFEPQVFVQPFNSKLTSLPVLYEVHPGPLPDFLPGLEPIITQPLSQISTLELAVFETVTTPLRGESLSITLVVFISTNLPSSSLNRHFGNAAIINLFGLTLKTRELAEYTQTSITHQTKHGGVKLKDPQANSIRMILSRFSSCKPPIYPETHQAIPAVKRHWRKIQLNLYCESRSKFICPDRIRRWKFAQRRTRNLSAFAPLLVDRALHSDPMQIFGGNPAKKC